MEPESNQASITGSTRCITAGAPPAAAQSGHGTVTSSMAGRCGSTPDTSVPASAPNSARDPTQTVCPSSHRHTGRGVPQNRSRDSAQSMLLDSHSPMRPSRMCSGCQPMVWFCPTRSALRSDVRMYQLGLPQ